MEGDKKELYRLRAAKVLSSLKKRGMDGYYAESREQAIPILLSLIPSGSLVAWGGSITLARDLKFYDILRKGPYKILDRDAAKTPEEVEKVFRESFFADSYLMSSNAISMDGELVNIDGRGNRVAALIYGPRQVLVVAGCNKICPDLDSAIRRAREEAGPPNAERLKMNTPCRQDGACHECLGEDCICCQTVITRRSRNPGRIKLILIGEDLGF